jgi:phage terminase small subunit
VRGRRPKPRNLKIVQGTFRRDRAKNEPQPVSIAPSCPRWLPAAAKSEWRRLKPELEELGLLTELDRAGFAGYCASVARFRQARLVFSGNFFELFLGSPCDLQIPGHR